MFQASQLNQNNLTMTAAKTKMNSLTGSGSRKVRQTASSCAEIISKSSARESLLVSRIKHY